ncbi:branched-chain-amino-acid aminotransferase 2, chloroplastic-like [Ipomoea triloba]|uniref:branched-chain-amino-acid aminotransferase 2, chloroplastic-like n=1 Tax=Ipomoea triloba TaxID=35885 RepID=UPI00125DA03A|nr:branched-chain-amino-acid aminotransferase 2, chloroplastic-like [Ipomoea triloba]
MIQRAASLRRLVNSAFLPQLGARPIATHAASSLRLASDPYSGEEIADIDWDNIGFGPKPTDYMYMTKFNKDGTFEEGQLSPFGNIELTPQAGVLNYGQGLFEGIKAFRRETGGMFLFRPEQNGMRMKIGAERMCMPAPSVEHFVEAVKQTALANKRWIPPSGKGSLYVRPLLLATGPVLGVAPALDYTFIVYACPVANYFKEGTSSLNLYVEDEYHRATHGGAGGVKSVTNYAPVLKAIMRAKQRGFSEVLYLDSVHESYIEEASASNIFIVKGNVVSTPPANGTILEGVTRKSIMAIARDLGFEVEERMIHVDELRSAEEVFCTGTAVGVCTVGSITYKGNRVEYKIGSVSQKLSSTLAGIQAGTVEDKNGWVVEIGQ